MRICEEADFILLNCTNTQLSRKPFRHALYYVLNILSLRTATTRTVPLPNALNIVGRMDFEAERDGAWQRLPRQVLDFLGQQRPDAAIKFGMGLLRVPEQLDCRILSYHHGDPRHFRGRPAGFYELLGDVSTIGQVVQIISNRLDAGAIVAFAETRVRPHSYRSSMADAYATSPLLLKRALDNCLSGKVLPFEPAGRNYRLPSNWAVLRFAAKLLRAKAARLFYGAFFLKAWEVASAEATTDTPARLIDAVGDAARWEIAPRPLKYQFLADPFPHPNGGVLVEALRRSDGQGDIVHFAGDTVRTLCSGPGHFSYPATIKAGNDWYMVPEVSEWAEPQVFRLTGEGCEFVGELKVEGAPRLVDGTLYAADNAFYLFANDASEGSDVLRLWSADSLFSPFTEHPESPIRISPAGGRMAGALLRSGGRLYRMGQDCARGYGRQIVLFEILALSRSTYEETVAGDLSFTTVNGPHTLNLRGGRAYFDFYRERFSLLAGTGRLRATIAKRRARRMTV